MYAPRYALGQYDTYTIDVGSSKYSSSCTSASSAHSQSAAQSQSSRHSTSPSSHSQHWHSSTQSASCAMAVFAKLTTPINSPRTKRMFFISTSNFSRWFYLRTDASRRACPRRKNYNKQWNHSPHKPEVRHDQSPLRDTAHD